MNSFKIPKLPKGFDLSDLSFNEGKLFENLLATAPQGRTSLASIANKDTGIYY